MASGHGLRNIVCILPEHDDPEGLQANSARERIRASRLPTITPDVGSWTGRIAG